MNENITEAINVLANKIKEPITADGALKYTQGLLNLAHAKTVLNNLKKQDE